MYNCIACGGIGRWDEDITPGFNLQKRTEPLWAGKECQSCGGTGLMDFKAAVELSKKAEDIYFSNPQCNLADAVFITMYDYVKMNK